MGVKVPKYVRKTLTQPLKMNFKPRFDDLKFIAIQLLFMATFGLAAMGKWFPPGIPESFADQFGDTWLASLPGGLFLPYYTIAVTEAAAFFLALASLLLGEWMKDKPKIMLKSCLVLSLFIFVILAYGLRLVSEFQGTANAFFYFGATLIALYVTEKASGSADQ